MPRPVKRRRVCEPPRNARFGPLDGAPAEIVVLTVDEYETIRLIDLLGLTQEECAGQMGVARTTVQALYEAARAKLADMLVNGRLLHVEGGPYELCPRAGGCRGKRCAQSAGGSAFCARYQTISEDANMKIAVTYENGLVFQHFGHTQQFKLYTVENGKITSSEVVDTNGSGHGALAVFLKTHGVDTLICGGIGGGDIKLLAASGFYLGLPRGLLALFGGYVLAAAWVVPALIRGKIHRRSSIPMAPFFAVSLILSLLWGEQILNWYLNLVLRGGV